MAERNPILTIAGKKIQTVGDVHLGRKYINGVPFHMRGTMEEMQRAKFKALLATPSVQGYVLVGDLFDSFVVDPADVDFAAGSLLDAARAAPDRWFVVLAGNHDESKDLSRKSSFDNFRLIVKEANLANVRLVEAPVVFEGMGFISWSARYSAKELAEQLVAKNTGQLDAVFGHWDVHLPDNANHYNMVPVEQLKTITSKIVTGHVHTPETLERDGVEIIITGSVLPLAHGEDIESDELFYTVTREEYDKDPKRYERKFLRFVLEEDEELPEGDFLQIKTYVKPTKGKTPLDQDDDEPTEFDVGKILMKFLLDNDVDKTRATNVVERFNAKQDRD